MNGTRITPTSPDFEIYRAYFRENPNQLWAGEAHRRAEQVMCRANELKATIENKHSRHGVTFELYSWVDLTTDNVCLKAYMRENMDKPPSERGPEYAVACAITRKDIRDLDGSEMDSLIEKLWVDLAAAVWERPSQYVKDEGAATPLMRASA